MATIDERFLKPHPRTVLWMAQRELCLTCAGMIKTGPSMVCSRTPSALRGKAAELAPHAQCIDARELGQPCGPNAMLYSPVLAD